MKVKNYFSRMLLLAAMLLLPWVTEAQVAKVSEYDFAADTLAYTSVAGNGGTAWNATDVTNGYTTFTMPFGIQFGQSRINAGTIMYVSKDGYVTTGDATRSGIVIAPLGCTAGFSNVTATSVYTKMESDKVIVEWHKLKVASNTVSFQLELTRMGVIKFHYGPMTLQVSSTVYAGMQSSSVDVYNVGTISNRWDTIVPNYGSIATTRILSPTVHPYYDVNLSRGLVYTFTQPECAKPNSFGVVPGDYNATFNWTGNGAKYQIKYKAGSDFAPMTEGTLIDDLTGISYTLENLNNRTDYYAYIRAYCSTSGSWSAWRAIADNHFTTLCGYEPLPINMSAANGQPDCWDLIAGSSEARAPYFTSNYIIMNSGSDEGYDQNSYVVLPKVNANLNNYQLLFDASCENMAYGKLSIGYIPNINNPAGFVSLTDVDLTTYTESYRFYLCDYNAIPTTARLAFRWTETVSTSYYQAFLNNIQVKPLPTCFDVENPTVSNITGSSAQIAWEDVHNTSHTWQIVYGAPGFDPALATTNIVDVTTNPATLTNLEGSTPYEVYVRAKCGTENTDWIGPVSFATPCPTMTITKANPYTQDFEGDYPTSCWSMVYGDGSGTNNPMMHTTDQAHSGSQSYRFSSYSSTSDYNQYLISPELSCTSAMLASFQYRGYGSSDVFKVGYSTTTNELSAFTWSDQITPSTTWQEYSTELPAGTKYVAIDYYGNYAYYLYVDDVMISVAPTCSNPSAFAQNADGALTWNGGTATQWQVKYALEANAENASAWTTSPVLTTTTYSNPAWVAKSQYVAYVRSICGANDTNAWVGPLTFIAPCPTSCLLTLNMTDSYGDGWNGASISVYQDNVLLGNYTVSGSTNTENITLCGGSNVTLQWNTGSYDDECSMTITHNGSTIYNGGAPSGTFASFTACPNCNDPSNIEGNMTITWTAGNTTQWQVRWAEQGSTNYNYAYVNTPSYTSASWTSNMNYTIEVRSICGANDTLGWVSYDFTTPCMPRSITDEAYSEDFNSYAAGVTSSTAPSPAYNNGTNPMPSCWTFLGRSTSTSSYPQVFLTAYSSYAVSGNCLFFKSSSSTPLYAVLPQFTSNINTLQINFTYRNEGTTASNGTLSLGYMTDPTNASTFVEVESFARTTTKTEKEHMFSADGISGTNYYIAFKYTGGTSNNYYAAIDNVSVCVIPTCPKPTNLEASNVSYNSATLAWTEVNAATQWVVKYADHQITGEETDVDSVLVSVNPTVNLASLRPNSTYYVRVRSLCSASDVSPWSNAISFNTSCAVPFLEEFSASSIPATWYQRQGILTSVYSGTSLTSGGNWGMKTTLQGLPAYHAYNNVYGSSRKDWLISPSIYINVNAMLSFDLALTAYNGNGSAAMTGTDDKFAVLVSTDNGTTWTQANTLGLWDNAGSERVYNNIATTGETIEFPLTNYLGQNIRLAFYVESTESNADNNLHIDNVQISQIRNCKRPSNVLVSNITTNSAQIAWTDNNDVAPANGWQVAYGPQGFDVTTATPVAATTNPLTLNGLNASSSYDIYVRAVCAEGDESNWSSVTTFNTACEAITLTLANPYIYGFEDATGSGAAHAISQCWLKGTNYTTAYPYPSSSYVSYNTNHITPTNDYCLYFYATANYYSYAVLPEFTNNVSDLQISLKALRTSSTATYGVLQVGVITDLNDISTFHMVQQIQPTYSSSYNWQTFEIPLSGYTGANGRIALVAPYLGTNYVYVDDITVSLLPPCVKPSNVLANATTNAAVVTWQGNSQVAENSYDVVYGPTGTVNPATATPTTVTNATITLTGLTANTAYDVYVRANCGSENGYSDWSNVYTFTTECEPWTITLTNMVTEDFESYGTGAGNIPNCWTVMNSSTDPYVYASSTYSNFTTQFFGLNYAATVATNRISNPIADIQLAFDFTQESLTSTSCGPLYVGFTTDKNATESQIIWVDTLNNSANKEVEHKEIDFSKVTTTNPGFIVFMGKSSNYLLAIDNFELSLLPPCRKATNVAATTLTNNSVVIDWTQNTKPASATEGSWEVMFGVSPLDITTATVQTLTDHIFTNTNLDPNTTYDFYVRPNCGSNGYGDWSNVYTFTTFCDPMNVTGYEEDFTAYNYNNNNTSHYPYYGPTADFLPSCWNFYSNGLNNPWMNASTTTSYYNPCVANYNGTSYGSMVANDNYLFLGGVSNSSSYVTTYGNCKYAVMPQFSSPISNLAVSFTYKTSTATDSYMDLSFGYITNNDTATYVELMNLPLSTATTGVNVDVVVPEAMYYKNLTSIPENARFAFRQKALSTTTCYSGVDNIVITPAPTCYKPVVTTALANVNSVSLTWTEKTIPVAATNWEVAVGTPGFNPDIAGQHVTTTLNTNYPFTGLKHSTTYEVRVRALCTSDDWSDWSEPYLFTTGCATWQLADMPLTENFDYVTGVTSGTVANHVLAKCWDYNNDGTYSSNMGYPIAYKDASYSRSGENHLRFYTNAVGQTNNFGNQIAIFPQMGFDVDTLDMELYARKYSTSSNYTFDFEVGVMTDPNDASTFVSVETINPASTEYELFTVKFDTYQGNGRYIAIRAEKPASGTKYVLVDDITLKLREPIVYLPTAENHNCNVFYHIDTTNGTYASNLNMVQTLYPAEQGKVLHLTGYLDAEYGYDYLTIYEGADTTGNVLFRGTGAQNIDVMSDSYDWNNKGAMTLQFTSDVDNAGNYEGFKLFAECVCPAIAPERQWTEETHQNYTWVNGRTYSNNVTVANQPDKIWNEEYMEKNVAGCDSVYHTLALTIHPTYTLTFNEEICGGESFDFYGQTYTTTNNYSVTLQTVHGADSVGNLNLTVHPAPTAYIYVNNARTEGVLNALCDNAPLVMTARSTIDGSNFVWENESTDAIRTEYPHESGSYSVTAYDPLYNCSSAPVSLSVTTTPVAALSLDVTASTICAGQNTTITVIDSNNLGCTYSWSNGMTGNSITVTPAQTTTYTVTATTPNASACQTTAETTITVNPLPVVTVSTSATEICRYQSLTLSATEVEGYTYNWTNAGNITTATATINPTENRAYSLTVVDANGCQNEFTTANVAVRPAYNIKDTLSVCEAMLPITWGQQNLNAAGDYDQTWTIAYGCDSTVHLNLIVTETGVENTYREYCQGTVFTFGTGIYAQTYTAQQTGVISYLDSTSNTCPVVQNLYLTVNNPAASSFDEDVCDSYTWNDVTYTETGVYNQTLATTKSCDSVVTLNLTVRHSNAATDVQDVCDRLTWINGQTYTEPNNTATFTLTNAAGCDSVVTLNLTNVRHATTGVDNIIWCDTPTYTWIDGQTYDMNETDGTVSYQLTGVQNAAGCDTTAVLNLVLNITMDTTALIETTVCDIFIVDTMACDGTIAECQITASGTYALRTPIANTNRYRISRYNVTVNPSEYHTTMATNKCLPYTWYDADNLVIATINNITNGSDTVISHTIPGIQTENGCDRTEILRLSALFPTHAVEQGEICLGQSYTTFNGYTFAPSTVGDLEQVLPTNTLNSDGCPIDSVLQLTVKPSYDDNATIELCESLFVMDEATGKLTYTYQDPLHDFNTIDLTIDGALNDAEAEFVQIANWQTDMGCDSNITLTYHVYPTTHEIVNQEMLYSYTWDLNGETYDNEGIYDIPVTLEGQNDFGCDHVVTLHLVLHDTVYFAIDTFVCTSYLGLDGQDYREDMTFTKILPGASQWGTDSVINTNFHVMQRTLTDQYVASNLPYTWIDGNTYTTNTEAYYNLIGVGGCDSTLMIHFTKLDSIVLCEESLPYATGLGFDIVDPISNIWSNNDPMGNDTIVSYTVNLGTYNTSTEVACETYTWNNTEYTTSGDYLYNYVNANGCASTDTLHLTVNHNTNAGYTDTVCDVYTWHGTEYKTSGDYTYSYLTTEDCPSVDTLHLTVNYNSNTAYSEVACDTYTWNNTAYSVSGIYTFDYTAQNGCPSVDTLKLTIGHSGASTDNQIACDSYTWPINNQTYTDDIVVIDTIASFAGCDSVITLNLTILHNTNVSETVTDCDSYTWHGTVYTASTTAYYTYNAANTCPSVDTLYLTINNSTHNVDTVTECDSYTWNGVDYTISGVYTYDYSNDLLCPSVDTLKLTINRSKDTTILITSSTGSYIYHFADNNQTFDTLFQATAPTYFGPFVEHHTNVAGCDSIVTINFLIGTTRNRVETYVACQEFTWERNNVTYVYIDAAESAANNGAIYKTTDGQYIYENPMIQLSNNNAVDSNIMLNLIITPNYVGDTSIDHLLSNPTLVLGDSIFDYSALKAAHQNGLDTVTVHHHSDYYCDSVMTYYVNLIYNYDTTTMNICATQTEVVWGSNNYTTDVPGSDYVFDTIDADGWIHTLAIHQYPAYTGVDVKEACDSLLWNGTMFYANNNTALDTLAHAVNGCDSIVTLNLTVLNATHNAQTESECASFTWHEAAYTATGDYTFNYTNAVGCPSVDTLHLTILQPAATNLYDSVCFVQGVTAAAGTTTPSVQHLTAENGCDSVVTTYTYVKATSAFTDVQTACDTYTWIDGNAYTANNNTATYTLQNAAGCDSVITLNLTINHSTTGIDEVVACDSIEWNNTMYYIDNYTATKTIQNVAGCDSVVTLNLTMKYGMHLVTVETQCDAYTWMAAGNSYSYDSTVTYPLIDTYSYLNIQGCPSVDTLKLTLKPVSSETFYDTACLSYTWTNNGTTLPAYTQSGTYTNNYYNEAGCLSTDILNLVINQNAAGSDTIVTSAGYYYYNNVLYTADRHGNEDFDTVFTEMLASVNGCDSVVSHYLYVGTTAIHIQNAVSCDHYTWTNGNNHTYVYDENKPAGALYKDATDDVYVYSNPRYIHPDMTSYLGYDTVEVLNLTLTQTLYTEQNVNFLLSQGVCYFADSTRSVNFTGHAAGLVDTAFSFGATTRYCDSVITYHVNLIENWDTIAAGDVCATAPSYTWDNTSTLGGHMVTVDLTQIITDYDHESMIVISDTVFKGDLNNEYVFFKTLTVHPLVYATERRTACDTYTWNGTLFTENNSTATRFFPNGSSYGCDSTVTLNLTIKYNTNTGYVDTACNSYFWTLDSNAYTQSGDYYRSYTAANGCPSVDTLHLTVNYSTSHLDIVDECDSYVWHGMSFTQSDSTVFSYNTAEGCASVDTLYLTIRNNSNHGYYDTVCDSYTWTLNNNAVYTTSDTYYREYTAENGCASVDTLYLVVNHNTGHNIDVNACDTYTWNENTYTESGVYFKNYLTAENCPSVDTLTLTVGITTNVNDTVIACHSYTWHEADYTTSGVKTYSYINADGCPSNDTLYLTINNNTTFGVERITHCGEFTWIVNDSVIDSYTESVETSTSFTNPRTMCDSIVYLKLTVNPDYTFNETATICETELPYTWRGVEMAAAGDTNVVFHIANNCDSTFNFSLTVNPVLYETLNEHVCLGQEYHDGLFDLAEEIAAPGTYTFTKTTSSVVTGCDSIVTLNITVGELLANVETQVACDKYEWNGNLYTTSGVYFTAIYDNALGCQSIDSLYLTINNSTFSADTLTACDSYEWNGTTYTASADPIFQTLNAAGCDSTATLHLTVNFSNASADTMTVCDSYDWNGTTYTASADPVALLTNAAGCDSTATLHLTVNYSSTSDETFTACDSYDWNGTTYTASAEPVFHFTNAAGCDSAATLHLTVNYSTTSVDSVTACTNYTWNGITYASSNTYNTHFTNAAGCDSTATLVLTINNTTISHDTVIACDSYEWNGQVYTSSADHSVHFTNAAGCDSTAFLHLTVNYNTNTIFTDTVCDSYNWNNVNYTTSGVYAYNYNAANGCPSVDSLYLTVNYKSNQGETVVACDSYEWNGTSYTTSGTYYYDYQTLEGCQSTDTLYLTVNYNNNRSRTIIACDEYIWNGETYTESGDYFYSYEHTNGCPSTDTLHLTLNTNTNTAYTVDACDSYTWNGDLYNAEGTYTYDYIATNNCPSTDTLVLTLRQSVTGSFVAEACNFYAWNGAAYTQSGIYYQTLDAANGCDSVVTMNLTINTRTYDTISADVCGSYSWNNIDYTATGFYTQAFTSNGGCDSVVTLNLTVRPIATAIVNATACDSYTWNGTTYNASGNYTYTTTAANGCDSVTTLVLTLHNNTSSIETIVACDSYTWHGVTYTASNNSATFTSTNSDGCTHTTTLNLTVNQSTHNSTSQVACDSYTWNGNSYTTTGTYTNTYSNADGCLSVDTLHLTVNNSTSSVETVTACDSYTWHGNLYVGSTNTPTYSTTNAAGCDSVVTLNLTINHSTSQADTVTVCDSYTWNEGNGQTYTNSTLAVFNSTNAQGCVHYMSLNLTVNHSTASVDVATACDSYIWHGVTYAASTTIPTYTVQNVAGCDSVITLNLTVNYTANTVDEITNCDAYTWINGITYTESNYADTYTLNTEAGCDSIVTLNLTINHSVVAYDTVVITENDLPYIFGDQTITEAGDYTEILNTINGCDSTVLLHLVVTAVGIDDVVAEVEVNVYPNPTRGKVNISGADVLNVDVYDLFGRRVARFENTNFFDITNLNEGTYTLRITTPNGIAVRKVVKK